MHFAYRSLPPPQFGVSRCIRNSSLLQGPFVALQLSDNLGILAQERTANSAAACGWRDPKERRHIDRNKQSQCRKSVPPAYQKLVRARSVRHLSQSFVTSITKTEIEAFIDLESSV